MNKTRTLIFGAAVAAAMLFGGVIGATVLAKSSNPSANTFLAAASPTPTPKSNEATTHETGETASQETAENNGTARPAGGPGHGPSNETAAHEATEPATRESAETS
jgi:uncharacterized membrane protein